MKFVTALFACALLLGPAASAQNPPSTNAQETQSLPSAPSATQPRFPGAPAQPQQSPEAHSANAPGLKSLTPATPAAPGTAAPQATASPKAATPAAAATAPSAAKATATPQASSQGAVESSDYRIGVQVNLVDLIFTATDKHGHFIKNLKQDQMRLLDNGKPPMQIQAFESETGLPLRVGLLIDSSSSIRERFRFEQEAATQFLRQIVRPKSDQAFVIGFDSLPELTQDYTDNTEALAHGISVLRPGGGTALHDAIFAACEKLSKAPVRGAARRAIILLSDGDDNQSRHTREQAITAALRADTIVYVIDTDVTDMNRKGDRVLMRYAEATGGRVFFPLQLQDVAKAFSQIQDELRSQYVLAYKPQNFVSDGSYHTISLEVPKEPHVKIRVRRGYYAPTD